MSSVLAQTPLHDWHTAHGGRMVDFAGWSMPIQYTSIVEEHTATRAAAGLFDISHMGRFYFLGSGAAAFLDRLLTRQVTDMQPGQIRYATVTNDQGGVLDDVLIYDLEKPNGSPLFVLVVNAGNREKMVTWIESHLTDSDETTFEDRTFHTAMMAIQGPRALQIVQPLVGTELATVEYYSGLFTSIGSTSGLVSRTGYTGEDGCELIVPADSAGQIWDQVLKHGADQGIKPAGLGARDTLRLEAAMPLYGHELTEQINPFQAGLAFAVNLKDRDFIGREALMRMQADERQPQRVGLVMAGRRVPREHFSILLGDTVVGEVTSGTFSPTLECPIAMGYVRPEAAKVGTELAVDIRGRPEPARVVKTPFYRRT